MLTSRLGHRIHLQERMETTDSETGARSYVWTTVYLDSDTPLSALPAEVLDGPGREVHAANTKLAEADARINFRWFPGLRADMRILWDGNIYDIVSIGKDATGRREYRLRVKSGLTDGT